MIHMITVMSHVCLLWRLISLTLCQASLGHGQTHQHLESTVWGGRTKFRKGVRRLNMRTHPTMLCNVCGLESLPAVSRCWRTCLMFCKTSWTRGRSTGRPRCRSKALHSPARTLCWLSCSVYYWYGLIWYDIMYWIHEMVATWLRHLLPCTLWFQYQTEWRYAQNSSSHTAGSPGSSFGFALWKRFSLPSNFSGWLGCPSPYIWILGLAVYAV